MTKSKVSEKLTLDVARENITLKMVLIDLQLEKAKSIRTSLEKLNCMAGVVHTNVTFPVYLANSLENMGDYIRNCEALKKGLQAKLKKVS